MDSAGPGGEDAGAPPPEAMLERLRSLNGHWYELAKLLPLLARAGYDGMAVEEATGLERKTQNVWGTAAQVHESIRGVIPDAALAHYDVEGEELLYELRFLSIKQRAPVATYIAERNLRCARWGGAGKSGWAWCCAPTWVHNQPQAPSPQPLPPRGVMPCSPHDAQVLARAVKEHERREGRREGFGDTPGDVLAYKHFRDVSAGCWDPAPALCALCMRQMEGEAAAAVPSRARPAALQAQECRRTAEVEAAAKKGLAVADSDTAREKLVRLAAHPACCVRSRGMRKVACALGP